MVCTVCLSHTVQLIYFIFISLSLSLSPPPSFPLVLPRFSLPPYLPPSLPPSLHPSASSPVRNLSVSFLTSDASFTFDSTESSFNISLSLSWLTPSEPNGLISQYNYNITRTSSGAEIASGVSSDMSVTERVVVPPITAVTVEVSAVTSGGIVGESANMTVTSPDGGMSASLSLFCRFQYVCVCVPMNSHLMLSLSLPVYQVRLDWLPLPCIALIQPSQLSCLGNSVGRVSAS